MRLSPTVRNARRSGPSAPSSSSSRLTKTAALVAARVSGNRPSDAPSALVEVDERRQVGDRVGRVVEPDLARRPPPGGPCAGSRGAPSCPGCPGSRRSSRRPGTSTTGQTSSCSTLSVQPRRPRAARRRSPARPRPGRRSEGDGDPRRPTGGGGSGRRRRRGSRRARRRPPAVLGRGEQRRVVRVVGGAEEHGLGIGRDGGQRAGRPAWRIVVRSSMSPGSTSWRCISGTMPTGRASASGIRAGSPRPSPRARSRRRHPTSAVDAPARERRRPGVRVSQPVPVGLLDRVERATHRPQRGKPTGAVDSPMAGGQEGSPFREVGDTFASIAPDGRYACGRNKFWCWPAPPDAWSGAAPRRLARASGLLPSAPGCRAASPCPRPPHRLSSRSILDPSRTGV